MINLRQEKIKIFFCIIDLLVSFIAALSAALLYFYILEPEKQFNVLPDSFGFFAPGVIFPKTLGLIVTYSFLALIYSITQILFFLYYKIYDTENAFNPLSEFFQITKAVLINLIVVLALFFFYRGTSYSRFVILIIPFFSIILIFLEHRIIWYLTNIYYKQSHKIINTVLIGTGKIAEFFYTKYSNSNFGGNQIVAVLGKKPKLNSSLNLKYLGKLENLEKIITKFKPNIIFYAENINNSYFRNVQKICDKEAILYNIIFETSNLISSKSQLINFHGIPILNIKSSPLQNAINQIIKRIFDIIFSSISLIFLFPLLVFVTIAIKIDSIFRGLPFAPIFFSQERIGVDNKVFIVHKFRSMIPQSKLKSDKMWGKKNDTRITSLGKLLRLTSIDELPQLINVLLGDMSIVGPRPERPFFVQKFKSEYKSYMQRHLVKTGLTGWAQVNGLRGDTSIEKRIEADMYYIKNWSLLLDIKIILKTIPTIFKELRN